VGRRVAVKTLGGFADPQRRDRFRAEAEAVAQLQHPHIVQLYDFGEAKGVPYFSLELISGGSLETALESERPGPRKAAEWVETLARAMHVAHEHNIIHRDLKPSNVLIGEDGSLKISDFGLAKRTDNDSSQTRAGDIVGTPRFMSPEHAMSDPAKIGPATDIYSLGAVLYDLLVGEPPFSGVTILETLEKIRVQDAVPIRKRNAKVHADLDTIALKCLQKERRYRYATALDLADDLRRYLDGEPVVARPIGAGERLLRKVRETRSSARC
jgi:serine/threonine protein kinase